MRKIEGFSGHASIAKSRESKVLELGGKVVQAVEGEAVSRLGAMWYGKTKVYSEHDTAPLAAGTVPAGQAGQAIRYHNMFLAVISKNYP